MKRATAVDAQPGYLIECRCILGFGSICYPVRLRGVMEAVSDETRDAVSIKIEIMFVCAQC